MARRRSAVSRLLLTALAAAVLVGTLPAAISSAQLPACPTGFVVSKPSGGSVSNPVVFEARKPEPIAFAQVESVRFYLDGGASSLGGAVLESGVWKLPVAPVLPTGEHYVYAAFNIYNNTTGSTSQTCLTAPVAFAVASSASGSNASQFDILITDPATGRWQGPTNVAVPFRAKATLFENGAIKDVTATTDFAWSSNRGFLNPTSGSEVVFFSGPQAGNGSVTVTARYANRNASAAIDVNILQQSDASSYPAPVGGGNTTSKAAAQRLQREGDSRLRSCLASALANRQEGQRLSFDDFEKSQNCFKRLAYVVPHNLAPVAPQDIEKLPRSESLQVDKPASGPDSKRLILTGRAPAGKRVFIYIFSEPLVLTATTDNSGRWTYSLQNSPLEPGQHVAYVAVEQADGSVTRSGGQVFGVQAVAATANNPGGLSLVLAKEQQATILYAIVAGVLVSLGMVVIMIMRRVKSHDPDPLPNSPDTEPPAAISASPAGPTESGDLPPTTENDQPEINNKQG